MEVNVTLSTNRAWAEDFLRRLRREGFSQNQLAAAMGKSATQVSRWFTENPKRKVVPTLETVTQAEATLKEMMQRKRRRDRRAEANARPEGDDMNE